MTQHCDINIRLENWGRWATSVPRQIGISPTAAFCDRLRREAGITEDFSNERRSIDETDALLLERSMRRLIKPKRDTLRLHYVDQQRWQVVCRRARVRVSKEHFAMVLRQAQEAVAETVEKISSAHDIS